MPRPDGQPSGAFPWVRSSAGIRLPHSHRIRGTARIGRAVLYSLAQLADPRSTKMPPQP